MAQEKKDTAAAGTHSHTGHRQRLKNRFLSSGLDSFEPHEALELLLFYANPRSDTNPTAHALIEAFGSVSRVFEAEPQELCKVRGVNMHAATLISMIAPLTRLYTKDKWGQRPVISSSQAAGEFALSLYSGRAYEVVTVLCLDKAKRVLNVKVLNEGGIDSTPVYPRMVAELALLQKAWGVILIHNHPSGIARPSQDDKAATKRIASALSSVDVTLIDHIIIGGNQFVSMGDLGML